MRQILLLFSLLVFSSCGLAQEEDYVNDNVLRYDDYVYRQNIRTVQFHESSWDYAAPLIGLNKGEQLELSFDDLDSDKKSYTITFMLCNADWTPSDLMQSEYLQGYFDLNFLNFAFSFNTYQKYTHYSILFPQQGMAFTKSGNYIVYVYADGNRDNVVLSRRFMVFDDRVQVSASLRQSVGGQYTKQQLDFTINPAGYDITNPYKDLNVVLMQNNRWDNAVTDIKPTFIQGTQLVYSLDDKSAFNAGNEFRYFDARSLRFLTERVKDIYRDKDFMNHVVLYPDEVRSAKPYIFYNDFNGGFLIRNREVQDNMDTQADYVYVDFFLPYPKPEEKGNFYIMGKLTDWRMNKRSMMKYNDVKLGYEARLYLKQGYYNYIYVLSADGRKSGDESVTEGNFWDTENDYYILIYHRKFGTYYDQLLGYRKLNTLKK